MILGIGTDIIEIDRIEEGIKKNTLLLQRIFTEREIEVFQSKKLRYETIAANFAVKEAVSKAIGTGLRGFSFNDIEVLRDELGKPYVEVSQKVVDVIGYEAFTFNVSISHNKTMAVAFVILEDR